MTGWQLNNWARQSEVIGKSLECYRDENELDEVVAWYKVRRNASLDILFPEKGFTKHDGATVYVYVVLGLRMVIILDLGSLKTALRVEGGKSRNINGEVCYFISLAQVVLWDIPILVARIPPCIYMPCDPDLNWDFGMPF